jgi:hypothetical protein
MRNIRRERKKKRKKVDYHASASPYSPSRRIAMIGTYTIVFPTQTN